ncbi:MAG: S-layer homology domain-containing protein [Brevibacillus sp.]|nr:S-layer homology domain-containing protein [Brevibacillus sp.]
MQTKRRLTNWLFTCLFLPLMLAASWIPSVWAEQELSEQFEDVEHHWAKEAILRSYQMGLLGGVDGSNRFEPDRPMTRAEFIVLLDRLLLTAEHRLFPLTLLTEYDQYGWGEGFREPYLPYVDVDRLTWMYPSVLRVSLVMERLYGPGALEEVFPGGRLHPNQPITREEAGQLLRIFELYNQTTGQDGSGEPFSGTDEKQIKRGEAAALAVRLNEVLEKDFPLPLLDYHGQKFPLVHNISDLFPLFDAYMSEETPLVRRTYREAVEAVLAGEEWGFARLRKLAATSFSNQLGVQYYLSWDQDTPLSENMLHARRAIDEYFAANKAVPEVLRLLMANVYDLALQLEGEQPTVYKDSLDHLLPYLDTLQSGSAEWLDFSLYLAAMEMRSGAKEQALERYLQLTASPEGLTNALHYLIADGRLEEAKKLLGQAREAGHLEPGTLSALERELALISQQHEVAERLAASITRLEEMPGVEIEGESVLGGYIFRYVHQLDQRNRLSHLTGVYQAPDKLILQKMEMYKDLAAERLYRYDYDTASWQVEHGGSIEYVHEWVDSLSVPERLNMLHARYLLQRGNRYDVITEWIPANALVSKSEDLSVDGGRLTNVPAFVTKYYLDRESGMLTKRVWRYEEMYDSGEYISYLGEETYRTVDNQQIELPAAVRKGGLSRE